MFRSAPRLNVQRELNPGDLVSRDSVVLEHAVATDRPRLPTLVLRSITSQRFTIDNDLSVFRSELERRLSRRYESLALVLAAAFLVGVVSVSLYAGDGLLASFLVLGMFTLVVLMTALVFEQLVIGDLLAWQMRTRYPASRCWEMMIRRTGGVGNLPAVTLYTAHRYASPAVRAYLVERGFTEKDREVADVILADGTELTLDQLVTTAISLR